MNGFVKKEKKKKKTIIKKEDDVVRELTIDEKKNMKLSINSIEDHERQQLGAFVILDKIPYTETDGGILVNLSDVSTELTYKLYKYINRCINNKKYRQID